MAGAELRARTVYVVFSRKQRRYRWWDVRDWLSEEDFHCFVMLGETGVLTIVDWTDEGLDVLPLGIAGPGEERVWQWVHTVASEVLVVETAQLPESRWVWRPVGLYCVSVAKAALRISAPFVFTPRQLRCWLLARGALPLLEG